MRSAGSTILNFDILRQFLISLKKSTIQLSFFEKKKSISIVTVSYVFKIFDSERINKKILWKNKDEIELFLIGLFFHYYFVEWLGFFIKGLNCFFFFKEKEKEFELGKAMNSG